MSRRTIRVADLFCGAGGTSTGLARAAEQAGHDVELLAVNHWEVAVATHAANHPWARHVNAPLDGIDPRKVTGTRKLDVLVASPECTHHSTARGGRPVSDQSRASAWHVLTWAQALEPEWIVVENVPEFESWGPIGRNGRPMKSRRGETFEAWAAALRSLGYAVSWRVLNAADFGDPTTRRRLFVLARRGRSAAAWPDPTHQSPRVASGLFDSGVAPWRTARDSVIDWSLRGSSIFDRKRPLADATLRRIEEGIRRFAGPHAADFLVLLRGTSTVRGLDQPVPAITAGGGHLGLASYMVPFYGERAGQAPRTHDVAEPMPTLVASPKFGLAHLIEYYGTGGAASVNEPLGTATTRDRFALVEPFMLGQQSGGAPRSVSDPAPTVATGGAISLVAPARAGRNLDVLFRMLQPHELSRAMGFPADYQFKGNRGDVVRQIGNAVPVGVATALCKSAIEGLPRWSVA